MRAVVHDWSDADSVRILQSVRQAMSEEAKVLLVERVIAPPNEGRDAKLSDLNMLVVPGGRERTREEFAHLLGQAGLQLDRVVQAGGFCVLEGSVR